MAKTFPLKWVRNESPAINPARITRFSLSSFMARYKNRNEQNPRSIIATSGRKIMACSNTKGVEIKTNTGSIQNHRSWLGKCLIINRR